MLNITFACLPDSGCVVVEFRTLNLNIAVGPHRTQTSQSSPWYFSVWEAEIREGVPNFLDSFICVEFGEIWLPFAISAPSAVNIWVECRMMDDVALLASWR